MTEDQADALDLELVVKGTGMLDEADLGRLVTVVVEEEGIDSGRIEVGVHWVDADDIRSLNQRHRGVDEPTDVLSFPMDGVEELPAGMPRQLGDLVICESCVVAMVARGEGIDGEQTIEGALARCVIHGMLHLMGFDHGDEAARRTMRAREDQLLSRAIGDTP